VSGIAALKRFFFPEGARLRWKPFTAASTVGIIVGLALGFSDQAQRLDWQIYDRFMRVATRNAEPPGDIVVVAIDELSFSEIGMQWPWPRRVYAELIDKLARAGARTIVFDLLFDVDSTDPEDDHQLAAAMKQAGNVVLGADRADIADRAYSVVQWTGPAAPLAAAAADVGAVRLDYDPDGVLRRTPLSVDSHPGLALSAAKRAGFRPAAVLDRPLLVHFNGQPRRGIQTVSYYQALAPASLPASTFKDKTVFVGLSLAAPSTLERTADQFATPVSVQMAGVEVHANLLDTLLRQKLIADPFGSLSTLLALSLLLGAVASAQFYWLPAGVGIFSVGVSSVAWFLFSYWLLAAHAFRLPVVPPLATLGGAYAFGAIYRFALVNRERRFIRHAFEHYIDPAIVQVMLADPSKLRLGGEEREVTVLFSDIEGFTTLSERVTPSELQRHLSTYFTEMIQLLLREGATLDKLIGDSIMAYFGCPVGNPAHAEKACKAALAIQQRMLALNREWAAQGLPPLRTRIGINTGVVVAGNMGTPEIFNYTVLGDTVNLASRLEGVNKEYRTLIIIGEDTYRRAKAFFETRELDWIRVKGKARPVAIYELAADKGALPLERRQMFDHFAAGLALYRQGQWRTAQSEFEAALAIDPDDGPSSTFVQRCSQFQIQPPPPDWAAVHVMHSK
jgi:adenylate cyclase